MEKMQSVEIVPKETQMLNLQDKGFKSTILIIPNS